MNDPDPSSEYGFLHGIPQFDDVLPDELSVDKSAAWEEWMRWNPPLNEPPHDESGTSTNLDDLKAASTLSNTDGSSVSVSPHHMPTDFPFQFSNHNQNVIFSFGDDSDSSIMPQTHDGIAWNPIMNPSSRVMATTESIELHHGMARKPSEGTSSPHSSIEKHDDLHQPGLSSSTPSLHHSPESSNTRTTPSSVLSPEQSSPPKGKKRKNSEDSTDASKSNQPVKKTAHNMIEKRYRNNLNDKIAALKDAVPSLRAMGNSAKVDSEDLEGLSPANKNNKATILSKATEYIKHLEAKREEQDKMLNSLKTKLEQYERLVVSGTVPMTHPVSSPEGQAYADEHFANAGAANQAVVQHPPQGMIAVPENMRRLHGGMQKQQHYAQQHPAYPIYAPKSAHPHHRTRHQIPNGQGGNPFLNKFMVGSLAGLLILEGLGQRDEESADTPAERGLFAVPLPGLQTISRMIWQMFHPNHSANSRMIYELLKISMILVALAYIVFPVMVREPKKKKRRMVALSIKNTPSLASPVEVRRKAWLTAIQTVWVPQHNFLLEAAALGLKTLKLSTRKLVGWPGYAFLTGITEEQETSRVRAWEIALDSQLTGGDAEINKSRLLLTLLASGTLPDSPLRLMLKSLHIRVLLWEVANAGYRNWFLFEELSAKLARRYWNAARLEHHVQSNGNSGEVKGADSLPEHLSTLLDLGSDEVLINSIIQRAYNLAWNKPSAENGQVDLTMDTVVKDFAISSPLDALAAWWSGHIKRRGIVKFLDHSTPTLDDDIESDLNMAVKTAPPNSSAYFRALVAKSILLDDDREKNVYLALDALPAQKGLESPKARVINEIGGAPITGDSRMALTIAKILCLVEKAKSQNCPAARARAIAMINAFEFSESCLTMLGFVALYKMLNTLTFDESVRCEVSAKLEQFTNYLRCWIGTGAGKNIGITNSTRAVVVRRCLHMTKTLNGMRRTTSGGADSAYATSDEHEKRAAVAAAKSA